MPDVLPRRVTVVGPTARVDLSLPPQSRVAELVPMLVRLTGGEHAGTGWTLGRLGADPLAVTSTVDGAGIRDGELLYLHPAGAQPAPPVFDDVVDAIATAAGGPGGTWRPALSRAVGLGAALVAFGGTASVGPALGWPGAVDGLLAVVLLLAAAVVARAVGDPGAGAALAGAGLPASAVAGAAVAGTGPSAVAVGSAALALYAVLAAVGVGAHVAWFAAAFLVGATGCVGALVTLTTGVPASAVAAALTAVALVLCPLLPMTALRASRLPLPRVPGDRAAFGRDEPEVTGVEDRTRAATRLLTGLLAAVALIVTGAVVVLLEAPSSDRFAWALAGLAGLAMPLRARAYVAVGPRAALLAGGAVVLGVTGVHVVAAGSPALGAAVVLGVLGVGVIGVVSAVRAPGEQPSPYWTRLLDVLEFVALVSLVPLAGAVLGWYPAARSLGG